MRKYLVLLLALTCFHLGAETRFATAEPELISAQIVELIDLSDPLMLDIQAGDLTSLLDFNIRQLLLSKGADLREPSLDASLQESSGNPDSLDWSALKSYALNKLNLIKITMELGGTTIERKKFLSYHSDRFPLYTFQVKQIALPQNKLLRIDSLSFVDQNLKPEQQGISSVKWFEPVLASAALASIIYLLWTTE